MTCSLWVRRHQTGRYCTVEGPVVESAQHGLLAKWPMESGDPGLAESIGHCLLGRKWRIKASWGFGKANISVC